MSDRGRQPPDPVRRWLAAWCALMCAAALLVWRAPDVMRPLSVTRVDNLEIAGGTDATGIVTARAGVRLTTPTTGPILLSGTGSPNGSLTATKGSLYLQTDTAKVWQCTSDSGSVWTELGTGGGGGAMTISISKSASPASVDLSTEGNVDYLYIPNSTSPPIAQLNGVTHAPSNRGGYLMTSFRWRVGTSGNITADARSTTFTTTSDDLNASPLSTTLQAVAFNSNGGSTVADQGVFFHVPSRGGTGTRRVRIYGGNRDDTLTITASASDGSTAPVSVSNVASGPSSNNMYEILFTGPIGTELFVTGRTSLGTNTFPNFWCGAITVEDI